MTNTKHGEVLLTTFDPPHSETISPQARKKPQPQSSPTSVPSVPQKYEKIIPAIRRRFENEQPTIEETELILQYFEMKSTQYLFSKIPSGTRIRLCGHEIIVSYQNEMDTTSKLEMCNILFTHFFSDDGWIQKNIDYRDLNDNELWKKFDDRTYNVLRDAVPKAETDIHVDEMNPETQFRPEVKRTVVRSMSEIHRDDRDDYEDVRDGADIVTKRDEIDAQAVDFRDPFHEQAPFGQTEKITNDLIDYVIEKDVPDIQTFKKEMKKKYTEHPEILINHIQKKYGDVDIVCRWLENIRDVGKEFYNSIIESKESFLKRLYNEHGNKWQAEIAKEAVKFEAGRKLVGKTGKERESILDEMYRYYVKYLPNIRKFHIEDSAVPAFGRIKKARQSGESEENLMRFFDLLYEFEIKK